MAAADHRNIEKLKVYGVHSLLWHQVKKVYAAPLINQLSRVFKIDSQLSDGDLQRLGSDASLIDVVGVREDEIWIVQTLWEKRLIDSATTNRQFGIRSLFKMRVFNDPSLAGESLATLTRAEFIMRKAFPDVPVRTLCLVMHPEKPDFELHHVAIPKIPATEIVLGEETVRKTSLMFEEQIQQDHESLWTMPERLDDRLFRGLPPCRGGRTLGILGSMASRQLESQELLIWKERHFMDGLREDFNLDVPRDKVRHDLVDRLTGQGFIRKWESFYHLTTRGIARYLYCLAKYTKQANRGPMDVLDECIKQRDRILEKCGFV
ncbi:MAG: hypothetical protein K2R98_24590 [Gemmataceae bacterium]|nr:hypothetical protein [Gemmataceae bacterium]